jgi:hypothetical protein
MRGNPHRKARRTMGKLQKKKDIHGMLRSASRGGAAGL